MPQNYFDQFQKADATPAGNYFDQFEKHESAGNSSAVSEDAPDTFWEGVLNSGPQVLDAIGQSLKGYFKGATVDIPSTIFNSVKGAIDHPVKTAAHLALPGPLGDMVTGDDSMAGLREASANAGHDPEAFGRIMGQMSGQPAVTAGAAKVAPGAMRMAGTPIAAAGRVMNEYAPLSGMLPGMLEPRLLRIIERAIGGGIENVGEWMRKPPAVAPAQREIVPPNVPFEEGIFSEMPQNRQLPPSNVNFYAPERNPVPPMDLPPMAERPGLPPSTTHYQGPSSIVAPDALPAGPDMRALPPSRTHYAGPSSIEPGLEYVGPSPVTSPRQAPRMRINNEGNIVNLGTGEVSNVQGKTVSYPVKLAEILQKPFTEMSLSELETLSRMNLDKSVAKTVVAELKKRLEIPKDSPFFYKNRK